MKPNKQTNVNIKTKEGMQETTNDFCSWLFKENTQISAAHPLQISNKKNSLYFCFFLLSISPAELIQVSLQLTRLLPELNRGLGCQSVRGGRKKKKLNCLPHFFKVKPPSSLLAQDQVIYSPCRLKSVKHWLRVNHLP